MTPEFIPSSNFFIAFALASALGMFAGLINGLLVTKIGIPSIVATIGTLYFWRGLVNVISQGSGVAIVDVADGTWHHTLFVEKLFGLIPAQFIWFIVLTALMQWVYRYHKFGNHIHFVGDNKDSSQMMGINVDNIKIIAFVQLGFFSSLAGIFTMYEMLYFWPTQGSGLMLTTLAAVFVGGTSVGSTVPVDIIRRSKSKRIMIKILELPTDDQVVAGNSVNKSDISENLLNIVVKNLTEEQKKQIDIYDHGVLVEQITPGPAQESGIRRGDVLLLMDNIKIEKVTKRTINISVNSKTRWPGFFSSKTKKII